MTTEEIRTLLDERLLGRFFGKYEGVVSDSDDPKKLARIRARVPAVLGEDTESGWAMPCAVFGGGKDRGLIAVPEVGDTVWVEFAGGDVSRPIWTGTFWGAPETSGQPDDLADATGTEVPTCDGSEGGPGRLILRTRAGHRICLDDDGEVAIFANGNDRTEIRLTRSGEVVVKAETISLGKNAAEKVVLGDSFMQLFNQHTHPTGVGPSGPPVQPMMASHLSQVTSTE